MASKVAELLLKIKTVGEEQLENVKSIMSSVAQVGAAVFTALSAVVYKSIDAYKEQEDATRSLTQAMVNNGVYSKALQQDYLDQASALQKLSIYGDEQIVTAQAALQQQIGSQKITKELTQAILDFASAQKMDLASAAEVVGKSIGTTNNALGRYGIEVATAGSQADKTSQVIKGLNDKFGGQAAAAAGGLGAITQMNVAIGDLFEGLGERLAPIVTLVSKAITSLAQDTSIVTPLMDTLVATFEYIAKGGAYVTAAVKTLGETLGIVLAGGIEAVSQALEGNFRQAGQVVSDGMTAIKDRAVGNYEQLQQNLSAIDDAFLAKKDENIAEEEQKLSQSLARKKELAAKHSDELLAQQIEKDTAKREYDLALQDAQHAEDMARLATTEAEKTIALEQANLMRLEAEKKYLDEKLKATTSTEQKLALLKQKASIDDSIMQEKKKIQDLEREKKYHELQMQGYGQFFSGLATLSKSENSRLAGIGKAAAISKATIDAYVAINNALAQVPYPANIAAAAGIGIQAFSTVSQIAGVPLAEGGVVMPRPGGTQATIGEAGQAEAVIPLDRAGEFGFGGGGGITLNVYGGLLGDQSSAHEFAIAVDRELYKLRRNKESTAFDTGV